MNNIIEKIKKLLALATSSNEHEARLAADKAQQLLVAHNLKLQDVEGTNKAYTICEQSENKTRCSVQHKYVMSLINQFFFVETVQNRVLNRHTLKRELRWMFVGEAHNVEIAIYMHDFFNKAFVRLWNNYKKENNVGLRSRQSYMLGLHGGIYKQLSNTRKSVESEMGLVVVKDTGISKFLMDTFDNLRKDKAKKVDAGDMNAVNAGSKDGERLNIARGLGNSTEDKKSIGQQLRIE